MFRTLSWSWVVITYQWHWLHTPSPYCFISILRSFPTRPKQWQKNKNCTTTNLVTTRSTHRHPSEPPPSAMVGSGRSDSLYLLHIFLFLDMRIHLGDIPSPSPLGSPSLDSPWSTSPQVPLLSLLPSWWICPFRKEILQLFGCSVHHTDATPRGSFYLSITFRRYTFRLTEESIAFALSSCLGGTPAGFHVSYQSERHFRFSIANKAVSFMSMLFGGS